MKKIINIFKFEWVDKWWGDKFVRIPYIVPFVVTFSLILGAFAGGSSMINTMANADLNTTSITQVVTMAFIILYGMIVLESFIASDVLWVSFARSLVMFVFLALAFVIGVAGSIVILIIVSLFVLIIGLGTVLGGMTGSSDRGKKYILKGSDGSSREVTKDADGYYRDGTGRMYQDSVGGGVEEC